ncbi:MAG: SAM-dependent methyltransferase [Candidatus Margulisiibacteriota bacterium]|jgi:SAM-dependent MidA family methyltransferase
MKTDLFTLQDFVSRCDSIAAKISGTANTWGAGSFFSEKIPFGDVTSKEVAAQIVEIIVFFANQNKKNSKLHIYEFGAGLGILAINILNDLLDYYPSIYKKIIYHISDISTEKLIELKKLVVFKDHLKHMDFSILDLLDLKFKETEMPQIVLHTYLFDALDVRHIKVENNNIYEIQIKTKLPQNCKILDTSNFLPCYLNTKEVQNILNTDTKNITELKNKLILERRLKPLLEEEYKIVSLDKIKNISKEEKTNIKKFVKDKNINNEIFNFSQKIYESILNIIEKLPIESSFLAIDYLKQDIKSDTVSKNAINQMVSNYGVYQYYLVNQELVNYSVHSVKNDVIKNNKLHYSLIPNIIKNHNLYLIWNSNKIKEFNYLLNKTFVKKDFEIANNFITGIKACVHKDEIFNEFNKLNPLARENYFILSLLTHQLFINGFYEEAERYALESLACRSFLGTTTYQLLGNIEIKKGNLEKAEYFYKKILTITPLIEEAYIGLTYIYKQTKQYKKLIKQLKEWLYYTKANEANYIMLELIKAFHKNGNNKLSNKIFNWLAQQDFL